MAAGGAGSGPDHSRTERQTHGRGLVRIEKSHGEESRRNEGRGRQTDAGNPRYADEEVVSTSIVLAGVSPNAKFCEAGDMVRQ